jgi:hypothetical protein
MRIADILRTLANNLEHAEGGTPSGANASDTLVINFAIIKVS